MSNENAKSVRNLLSLTPLTLLFTLYSLHFTLFLINHLLNRHHQNALCAKVFQLADNLPEVFLLNH